MSRVVVGVFSFLLLMIVLSAAAIGLWWQEVHKPIHLDQTSEVFSIKSGSSIRGVSRELENKGVLSSPWLLESWARYKGQASDIKTGEYSLEKGMTVPSLFALFVDGKSIQYRVTVPEGVSVKELISILQKNETLVNDIPAETVATVLTEITGKKNPEGWFFPDTYFFTKGMSDRDILAQAFTKMTSELDSAWTARDKGLPLESPEEVLTLASIVEKETGAAEERPMIAGVFIGRLRKGMKLQTDPTVIYGMGEKYKGNIRKSDLLRDTPYNTYTRKGLPPTPIALPGKEALRAVVSPEKTDALFFVAKGGGLHHFSKTYSEHRKAVIKYLLNGKASRYQGDKK